MSRVQGRFVRLSQIGSDGGRDSDQLFHLRRWLRKVDGRLGKWVDREDSFKDWFPDRLSDDCKITTHIKNAI